MIEDLRSGRGPPLLSPHPGGLMRAVSWPVGGGISSDFSVTVGAGEKHAVRFRFNQLTGCLRIDVDGRPVARDFRMYSWRPTVRYELAVGEDEPHAVAIEKTRKRLRERSTAIRAWARQQGIAVSERGRIAASVIERYEAAARAR